MKAGWVSQEPCHVGTSFVFSVSAKHKGISLVLHLVCVLEVRLQLLLAFVEVWANTHSAEWGSLNLN